MAKHVKKKNEGESDIFHAIFALKKLKKGMELKY